MKKMKFISLFLGLILFPQFLLAQSIEEGTSTAQDGQSTEGKDFWVTFMQADQDNNNAFSLSLSISSVKACEVTISNPFTSYTETVSVIPGVVTKVNVYDENRDGGDVMVDNARNAMTKTGKVCYAVRSEQIDTCALHVTATENISLFATNYKRATFDATNIIPTPSLKNEYLIQTYTPSDHGGTSATQGSHFAIIATEDNTIVDFCPTVNTVKINEAYSALNFLGDSSLLSPEQLELVRYKIGRDTLHTPVLMKGQVYYVWTGKKDNHPGDLSGTYVCAREGKKIAVFQGCPHTNIPYQVKQRDHIFSQAMPTQYWGNTFVLTTSSNRPSDIIRIMALNDQTDIFIDGQKVHTIDFTTDTKRYWEFEIGAQGTYAKNGSCFVTTSCPCAVHMFMTSQQYHGDKKSNGDPAMLWINPIEQQIDQITFATYGSNNGTTYHYTNIVTSNPAGMTLDGASIASEFTQVSGSPLYYYLQKSLGTTGEGSTGGSHTLHCDGGNFIAHVYGFTENESYAYSAGGATKPLTQFITINGKIFTPESDNTLCGDDTVKFACHPDYEYEKILWEFGDGSPIDSVSDDSVAHYYPIPGVYYASCTIRRTSSNVCKGQSLETKIPIRVTIGNYKVNVDSVYVTPCRQEGKRMIVEIFLDNPAQVDLSSNNDSVKLGWNTQAQEHGFNPSMIHVIDKNKIEADIPESALPATDYAITLHIGSECPSGITNTELPFTLNYENVMTRRFQNVIGLQKSSFENFILSDFQWYKDSVLMPNEKNSVLNLGDQTDFVGEYYICFTMVNTTTGAKSTSCSCPVKFNESESKDMQFESTYIELQQAFQRAGEQIYVNTKGASTVEWYTIKGDLKHTLSLPEHGGLVTVPEEPGMYILRVTTDKEKRTFKFVVFNK